MLIDITSLKDYKLIKDVPLSWSDYSIQHFMRNVCTTPSGLIYELDQYDTDFTEINPDNLLRIMQLTWFYSKYILGITFCVDDKNSCILMSHLEFDAQINPELQPATYILTEEAPDNITKLLRSLEDEFIIHISSPE